MEEIKTFNDLLQIDLKRGLDKTLFFTLFTDREDEQGRTFKKVFSFDTVVKVKLKNNFINTTVGRYIFNKFVLPDEIFEDSYINVKLDKKAFKSITEILALAKNNGKIDAEEIANTIDRLTWLASVVSSIQGGGLQAKSLVLTDEGEAKINAIRDRLTDDISDEKLKESDEEVVKILKNEFKDTDLGEIVDSGAKGSYENNMKSTFGYRGKLQDSMIKGNLSDVSPLEYVRVNGLDGSYARSKLTAVGGYAGKLVQGGLSHTFVNTNKRDCGTQLFLTTIIKNPKDFLFKFVRIKGRKEPFVKLTDENKQLFVNKICEVRSVMYCKSNDGYCSTCFGEGYKINGITKNLSSLVTLITADIMNKSIDFVPSSRNTRRINPLNHGNPHYQSFLVRTIMRYLNLIISKFAYCND